MTGPINYGPKDAICVLMKHRRRVALRWNGARRWWMLDGQRVTLSELEDEAERYGERFLRYTDRPGRG